MQNMVEPLLKDPLNKGHNTKTSLLSTNSAISKRCANTVLSMKGKISWPLNVHYKEVPSTKCFTVVIIPFVPHHRLCVKQQGMATVEEK